MSSEDYSYTNDLDEGVLLSAVARRREQNHSPLAQVVAEMGDSHVNYDYLDDNNSLSAGFDDDFEDVRAALALEDFVGVDGSNLPSESFESNSVFDIGTDEPGTQTPSGASQQSVSGTDFDTLPIAPIAKRPIQAALPPRQPVPTTTATVTTSAIARRNNNASSSNYGNPTANVPALTAALVGLTDGKGPATPFKYMEMYNISSPSAPPNGVAAHTHSAQQQQPYHLNSSVKHGRDNYDHALNSRHESGAAGSSIGSYGVASRFAPRPPGTDTTSRNSKSSSSATAVPSRSGLPAPPVLQPSSIQNTTNKNDAEGFGFGIETFLHGTQFGFGRQPSFKRIAPGQPNLTSNVSKPYYLMPEMSTDGGPSADGQSGNAATAAPPQPPLAGGARGAVGDRNAEAFSNWLEALDPKANSAVSSARSVRGVAAHGSSPNSNNNTSNSPNNVAGAASGGNNTAGPSVGEDFKREVDVMMKDLLGDYDLTSGMTGVYAPNNSVASGLPPPGLSTTNTAVGGGTAAGRRGSVPPGATGGGKDPVRQLEYDAFLKDVRMLTPTARSPTAAGGVAAGGRGATADEERRRPFVKTTKTAVATVGPNPAFAVEEEKRTPAVRPSQRGPAGAGAAAGGPVAAAAPKSILNTASRVGSARLARDSATTTPGTTPSIAENNKNNNATASPSHDPQPPDASGAQNRRRRVWSTSVASRSSNEGISGAALDPSTEAETAEEPPKPAARRVSEVLGAAAHKTPPRPVPSPVVGPHPVTVNRAPRTAAAVVAAVAASENSLRGKKASPKQPSSPRADQKSKAPLCPSEETYEDMDEDLLAGGYMTGASMMRSAESLRDAKTPSKKADGDDDDETVMLAPSSPPKGDGAAASSSMHGRRFSSMDGHIGASLLRQKWHPSWKKNGTGAAASAKSPEQLVGGGKKATTPSPASAAASAPPPSSQPRPTLSHGQLQKQSSPSSDSPAEVSVGAQRRTSIPSLTANRTPLSGDSGRPANPLPLPLPSFTPNRVTAVDSLHGNSTNATSPLQRDSARKGASVLTMDSVSRASRRASTSPSTVEPIVLTDRERPGFLRRASARSIDSRDDGDFGALHNGASAAAPPRRRLTEFRGGGDAALLPSSSRSRISINTTAEEARADAARQREREREVQQANEERRQRIQAFMAKRKAEKQMEELRRGQFMERDRQLEAFREEQERQRIYDATAPDAVGESSAAGHHQQQQQQQNQSPKAGGGVVVGSGLNAIKASQRTRKPTLDRPLRPSVPTASFIPDSSTVPMSPQQQQQQQQSNLHNEASLSGTGARRKRNASPGSTTSAAGAKARVRSVVVFMSSAAPNSVRGSASGVVTAAAGKNEEQRRLSTSSTASTAIYEGDTVAMELNEKDHMLKVLQPRERTRYYHVDEYVLIRDANPGGSTKSSVDKGGVAGSHNTPNALRNAAAAGPRRRLISLTLTEMSRKFLAGVNVALLLGSTESAQDASVLAIREVVEGVVSHMPAQSKLFVSVAYLVAGNTEDLLTEPPRSVRSTFGTSPLFGPTLENVEYVPVTGAGHLLRTVADAYKRVKVGQPQQSEPGLLVISLLLKQCRDTDVVLSSYLISDAGCDGSMYTAILRKAPNAPFALFHSALGGPTLTTALMAADADDVTTVVPLLNVQHRLSTVMNKPCHVGSVRRFMELAQRELDSADGKASKTSTPATRPGNTGGGGANVNAVSNGSRRGSGNSLSNTLKSASNSKLAAAGRQPVAAAGTSTSSAGAGASRPQIHKRLAEQVAMAKQILEDPQGYLPKSLSSAEAEDQSSISTAPPSAATAPRTQLTKKQENEAAGLQLSNGGQKRRVSHNVPATAAAAVTAAKTKADADATAAAKTAAGQGSAAAAADGTTKPAAASSNGAVLLPSILPVPTTAANAAKANGARKDLASGARAPPMVSAVPLKHPGVAPTELPSPLPHAARRPSTNNNNNNTNSSASRDPQGSASVRHSRNSISEAPLGVSQVRGSRDGGGGGGGAPLPLRRSVSNEQSVSASSEYVRRGRGGDEAGQRNTGFMNFEDAAGASQSIPVVGKAPANTTAQQPQQQQQQRLRNPSKSTDHAELPPRPATTMAPTFNSAAVSAQDSASASRRRVSADGGRPGSGLQPFAPPTFQAGTLGGNNNTNNNNVSCLNNNNNGNGTGGNNNNTGNKKLLPGATTIGSNGPQWPSTPAFEIPTIPSVASIDTSFTHDVSISMRQSSNAYDGDKAPIPTSTKVRTLVVVDARCRETSNVTYDNTMVIATTEDDFEEYDVDEVREATPGQKELIQAELLKELCDTLLMGCNAAILGADSRPTGFSAQVLKSVVHTIFAEMSREGTHRSGRLSASIVKVKGESVVDLLKDGGDAQKLVIAISPLFGSCVHGVTYADVESGAAFNDIIDAALRRATAHDNGRDYGFLFCSLLFKLRLEEEGDVQVCSLVATFAGENVGLYTSVLDRSPLVPRALFHYALGGPSYTIALLGIGSEETRANQMLQVQKRLGEMSNRATHPGSVAKFVAGIRNDLTPNLIAKYENSRDPSERAATKEMIERLAEMVKDADALLVDFDHHQPKAYLHGDAEQQDSGSSGSNDNANNNNNKQQQRRSTPLSAPPNAASVSGSTSNPNSKTGRSNDASVSSPQSTSAAAAVPARPAAAQRALPSITAVNPEAEGERIQSLVCFEQVMMGAGTVAVQGNTILCASQGGTRFDSDEVITCDENHRSLASKLMDELVAKFLSGHHTALLAADSSYSAFTPLMLRHLANNILEAVLGGSAGGQDEDNGFAFTKPPTISGELQVSIALIKDDVTADLLPIDVDATYHRFEMEHTPLYGPRVLGVTPHLVANPQDFDHFLAVAIDNADPALQTADPGIMVVSLVLTQRVTKPVEDVLVSSLLCTAVFDAVHHYERVLEGNQAEPLDLFKNVLRGPCFSVAMLGISDEEEDPGKLLRALNDLSQVRNKPPQVNSVSRHIRELQRGIVKLKERMTTSSNADEKAYIQSRVEVAEKLLEEAESLQRTPLSLMQPRAFVPLGGTADMR